MGPARGAPPAVEGLGKVRRAARSLMAATGVSFMNRLSLTCPLCDNAKPVRLGDARREPLGASRGRASAQPTRPKTVLVWRKATWKRK